MALLLGYLFVVAPLVQDGDMVTLATWTPVFLAAALLVHRRRDA